MIQLLLPFDEDQSSERRKKPQTLGCVYCGGTANTRDHVPPKSLLEKPFPENLRTVPACQRCNSAWSTDEEYTAIVLAQVGHVPHLMAKIEAGGVVDRALAASPGLDAIVTRALQVAEDGRVWFTPDLDRIGRIATKIAYGLYCLNYGTARSKEQFSLHWLAGPGQELPQHLVAAQYVWPGIRRKRMRVVQKDVFSFLFAQGWMVGDPPLYCLMDFHNTIFAAVSCPAPVGQKAKNRLRAKAWR